MRKLASWWSCIKKGLCLNTRLVKPDIVKIIKPLIWGSWPTVVGRGGGGGGGGFRLVMDNVDTSCAFWYTWLFLIALQSTVWLSFRKSISGHHFQRTRILLIRVFNTIEIFFYIVYSKTFLQKKCDFSLCKLFYINLGFLLVG